MSSRCICIEIGCFRGFCLDSSVAVLHAVGERSTRRVLVDPDHRLHDGHSLPTEHGTRRMCSRIITACDTMLGAPRLSLRCGQHQTLHALHLSSRHRTVFEWHHLRSLQRFCLGDRMTSQVLQPLVLSMHQLRFCLDSFPNGEQVKE